MNNKKRQSNPDSALYLAIMNLKDIDECYRFFQDLCTVSEMKAMEQRFEVARLLAEGKIYNDILEQTGASSATISRFGRSLNYGNDTYRDIFPRLDSLQNAEKQADGEETDE